MTRTEIDQTAVYEIIVSALAGSSTRYRPVARRRYGMLHTALNVLKDASAGAQEVKLGDQKWSSKMEAYNIGLLDWIVVKRICEVTQRFDEDARVEGFTFRFETRPSLDGLKLPECNCSGADYEISDKVTIDGNCYDANADTWATMLNVKAERLYLFWITDLKQFGVVRMSYWCL